MISINALIMNNISLNETLLKLLNFNIKLKYRKLIWNPLYMYTNAFVYLSCNNNLHEITKSVIQ